MGDTGLELGPGGQVRPKTPVLLWFDALRSAQVRSTRYQNCYQARPSTRTEAGAFSAAWARVVMPSMPTPQLALDPGIAEALLRHWACGEPSAALLDDARQISTGALLVGGGGCE